MGVARAHTFVCHYALIMDFFQAYVLSVCRQQTVNCQGMHSISLAIHCLHQSDTIIDFLPSCNANHVHPRESSVTAEISS